MNKRVVRLLSIVGAIVMVAPMLAAMPATRTKAAAQAQTGPAPGKTVTYCSPGGVDLKMDLYLPKTTGKPAPALLYVHGGGWTSGDRTMVNNVLNAGDLAARGYLVAAIDYRLAPQYKWPAQIEDVKCAVRYLRANAGTYGVDSSRIGVWGESSGGHLASMLALAGPSAGFEGKEGKLDESTTVQAVVDMCGPTDFTGVQRSPVAAGMSQSLLGIPLEQAGATLAKASPVSYVTGNAPPFLIIQGERDPLVLPSQSQELYDRLRAAGVPATLVMVKNGGHVFAPTGGPISPSLPQIQQTAYAFFDSMLKAPMANALYFTPTGKVARGKFLDYWTKNGGLAQQGYPISDEFTEKSETDGKVYTVQYFERAVFELHPENKAPYDVLLSLLGNFKYKQRYGAGGAPGQKPNTTAGSQLFPQTGHRVGGRFLQYWQQNGGLAQQGYPISDEFTEKNELNGQTYTVQYFERAVMEYHPENKAPYDVLLSQLGTFRYKDKVQGR